MILTIPYSHVDLHQALRLVRWLGWLSSLDSNSMKRVTVHLVPSRHASNRSVHSEIVQAASSVFRGFRIVHPEGEHEMGWPGACNFMLKTALEAATDDMFLLEPDAIPLTPEWWRTVQDEWTLARQNGKEFLGGYVSYDIPHMTGIGVYGRNWRSVAPKLAEVQNERGWDTYAADQILPNAHLTDLIQHKWWRMASTPYEALNLSGIRENAVIFHQDKQGRLFKLLDESLWQGRADAVVRYSEPQPEEIVTMHYFFTSNLNRVIRSQGLRFVFDPLTQIGGVWSGIKSTDKEAEVVALKALAQNYASTGVKELTAEEYEDLTKKKAPVSKPLKASPPQPVLSPTEAQINQSPALLVDGAASEEITPVSALESGKPVEDIESVIQIAKIKPIEAPKTAPKATRAKRSRSAA